MVAIAEADGVIALDELEAIEDAATDVARALEGVASVAGHQYPVPTRLEALGQIAVLAFPQDARADGGDGDQRCIEFDENLARVAGFRPLDGGDVTVLLECPIDVAHRKLQAPHGSVTDEIDPILGGRRCRHVDGCPGPRGERLLRFEPAETVGPRDADGGAHHAVVDDHDHDRGAAHDVDVVFGSLAANELRHVEPHEIVDKPRDALFRDTDEDDRLVVLHQAGALDDRVHVHGDEHVDGLTRIAGGVDDVGVEEHEAQLLIAAEGGGHRRTAPGGGEAVRAGEDFPRLDVPEKAFQLGG